MRFVSRKHTSGFVILIVFFIFIVFLVCLYKREWFETPYPCVPGHEIVGKIIAKGSEVNEFQIGDTVGVGYMKDSCGKCCKLVRLSISRQL